VADNFCAAFFYIAWPALCWSVGMIVGLKLRELEVREAHALLVQAGFGEWIIDPRNGKTEFRMKRKESHRG
jgi:hypothetical protein